MLLSNFVSKNCEVPFVTKSKHISTIRKVNKKLLNNSIQHEKLITSLINDVSLNQW